MMVRLKEGALAALAVALCIALSVPAGAESDDGGVLEAGPEDGILCCGGVNTFLVHGHEVLATTGRAGIFKSENRGERWRRSMRGLVAPNGVSLFVDFLCQAPSQPRIVYAVAGLGSFVTPFNGLFSSDDFGETWTRRAPVDTGNAFVSSFAECAVDAADPRTVYVSTADADFVGKLWKSTDGGQTVQVFGASLPTDFFPAVLRTVRGTLYVQLSQGVYTSTDGGASFRLLPVPQDFQGAFDASPDGRAIFLNTVDASTPPRLTGTFRSTDGGASFVPVSGHITPLLAFDPTDPSRIYDSDVIDGLLHVSTDGGLTFALLPASNDPRFLGFTGAIAVDPRGSVYLSTNGGPFRTDDGGETFRSLLDGFRASSVQDLAFDSDGKLLVGVLHTQVVFRQTHGSTFMPIGAPLISPSFFGTNAASVAGSPTDPHVVLVATPDQGLFRTDNGGSSWTSAVIAGNPSFPNSRMAFVTGSRVYLVSPGATSGLYRSDDAGQTFALLSSLPFGAIAVHPTDPDVLYVGTYVGNAGLFKSTDGGQTLQSLGQPGTFSALAVDRRNPQVVYAGERFGQVIRSLDGGLTFAPGSTGLAGAGVHGLAQDSRGTLFVWLRGGGLFASHDGASTWQPVDTGAALERSGVEAGRGSLVLDPRRPGRVYLGNEGVIQIDTGDDDHDE